MNSRVITTLAQMARREPLRSLHRLCESQKQVSTAKLEDYLLCAGDELAGYAEILRDEFNNIAAAPAAPVVQSGPAVQKILDLILGECKYWHHRDEARRGGFAALYAKAKEVADAAPPANDAALVEALERASKVMWSAECNLDVEAQEIERVLTAYRAALSRSSVIKILSR